MRIIRKLFTRLLLLVLAAAVAVCCLVGAGLMTIVAAGRTSSSVPGEVHWGTYLLWVFGVLLSCWVLRTQLGRGARS